MVYDVYVLNEGVGFTSTTTPSAPTAGTFNIKTSTNPTIVTVSPRFAGATESFYEIYSDNTNSFEGDNVAVVEGSNQNETPGYRVQLDTSSLTIDSNYHYFVLIYSDNLYKHHFAKFTEQTEYQGDIYNVDFTPRLKENIPAGTQVKIYKGPAITSKIVSLGYGLINDIVGSDERHDYYAEASRPTFYFFEGDQLEASEKYTVVKREVRVAGGVIQDSVSVFKTAPLTSDYILDKSFYTHNATIVDNNKDLDNSLEFNYTTKTYTSLAQPRIRNTSTGAGANYAFNREQWDDVGTGASSQNAYYTDAYLGPDKHNTYVKFINSPVRNQIIPSALKIKTNKTLTNKGNYFEAKFSDISKFLDKKVNTNERILVKEIIKAQNLEYLPKGVLFGVFNNHSSSDKIQVTGLSVGQDLNNLLYNSTTSTYELIFIDDYYYLPSNITTAADGGQVITIADRRAISSTEFEGSTTVVSMANATAYRKEWSPVVSNFIATHPIDCYIDGGTLKRNGDTITDVEADINGLEYRIDGDYYGFSITVLNGDYINNYVTFSDVPTSSYYANQNLFSSLKGNLIVNKIIFEGRIETVEKKIENGMHYITLSGRDDMAKLLSSPVNTNYLYSTEYVYSTISPFSDNMVDTGYSISSSGNNNFTHILNVSGTPSVDLNYGDVLYKKIDNKYHAIGVVATQYLTSDSPVTTTINLLNDLNYDLGSSYFSGSSTTNDLYVARRFMVAGKSSDISMRNTSATSLYGSLDKGYRFLGNGKILSNLGAESTNIKSISGDGITIDNLLITQGSSTDKKDSPIGLQSTTQLMSSITAMELVSSGINEETGLLDVEMGFVSPLVLGRINLNTDASGEQFYDEGMGIYLVNKNGLSQGGFIHLLNSKNNVSASSTLQYTPSIHKEIINDDRGGGSPSRINYSARFGPPIFRLNNVTPSALKYYNPYEVYTTRLKERIGRLYNENPASYFFYGSVFRIGGLDVFAKEYYHSSVAENLRSLPVEKSGYLPVLGSTGHDIKYYPSTFENTIEHIGPRRAYYNSSGNLDDSLTYSYKKDEENYDPSIVNAFLFCMGDVLPDSKKRPDNPFNQTIGRDLTNYFLMVKYKSSAGDNTLSHEFYEGTTKLLSTRDNEYNFFPIETASGTNPKRMNLLRLRSMTVDSLFNEVDFENYKTRTHFVEAHSDPAVATNSIPNGGISVYPCHTTSATSSSSTNISVDNSAGLRIDSGDATNFFNRYIFTNPADDSTGRSRFLGVIDTKTTTTLTLVSNCKVDAYEGEIFVVGFDMTNPYSGSLEATVPSTTDRYITGEDYIYPTATASEGLHNPNIHQIDGQTIVLNNPPNFTNRTYKINSELHSSAQSFRTYGAENHSTVAELTFSGADTTTYTNQTQIDITVAASGAVNADLSHYLVGQVVRVLDHGTTNKNTFYEIISKSSNVITGRTLTETAAGTWSVTDPTRTITLTTGNTNGLSVGMEVLGTDIASGATIASITGDTTFTMSSGAFTGSSYTPQTIDYKLELTDDAVNDSCSLVNLGRKDYYDTNNEFEGAFRFHNYHVGSRLLTEMSTPLAPIPPQENLPLIYKDMNAVVVTNKGASKSSLAANARLYASKIENIHSDNNYGVDITGHTNNTLTTGARYFGFTSPVDAELEKDVAEMLFIPRIKMINSNVSSFTGVYSTSDYDDYGYIVVDVSTDRLSVDSPSNTSHWINFIGSLAGKYLIQGSTLHYIVNHEINKNEGSTIRHYLLIDNFSSLSGTATLEVLTVCRHTTSQEKTHYPLYEFNSTNVINPGTGQFYNSTEMNRDWLAYSISSEGAVFLNNEAKVKGMFVVADVDGEGSDYLVHRNANNLPFSGANTVCVTDGRNQLKTTMTVDLNPSKSSTNVYTLIFDSMKKFFGSVSIGNIVNLSIIGKINREVDYVKIVLPFEIQTEAEEIADDILSSVGLTYNKSENYGTSDFEPYFLGSNFDGQDAFSAVNNSLSYKNLKLKVDGESFDILSDDTNKEYRNIQFAEDNTDYSIVGFSRDVSLFDKFNSVVVIGDNVRGVAKNHAEIKKDGTEKIKEIYDFSITGQTQVDERAIKALRSLSVLSNAIQIEVGSDIPHIQPGQIVELKFEREGIFRGEYLIIEVLKESGYPTKLLLGEYIKDLSTTLSSLQSETRNLQGRSKQVYKSYTSPSIGLQGLRVKFVKATITENTTTSSTVLGFGSTIGFGMGMGL